MFCLKSQKIKYDKLPFDFKERLVHLAPLKDLHNFGKACPDVKPACILRPDYHDQVKIVDSPGAYRSAVKLVFWLGILRFFNCLRYFYDGPFTISAVWGSVLKTQTILRKKRLIYVEDTLNLHCESIETCEKVIPFITGPYSRLIVTGNITWNQAKRLITAHVKQVRIDGRIHCRPEERSNFVNFVMKFCRGIIYKFSFDTNYDDHLRWNLVDALKRHKTHQANDTGSIMNIFSNVYDLLHVPPQVFLLFFSCGYVLCSKSIPKFIIGFIFYLCQALICYYFIKDVNRHLQV